MAVDTKPNGERQKAEEGGGGGGCSCSLAGNLASIRGAGARLCQEKEEPITFYFSGHHSPLLITHWH